MFNINDYLKERGLNKQTVLYNSYSSSFMTIDYFLSKTIGVCISVRNGNIEYSDTTEQYLDKMLRLNSIYNLANPADKPKIEELIKASVNEDNVVYVDLTRVPANLKDFSKKF